MANKRHLAILRQGARAWNDWRHEHREICPDLSGADLSEFDLDDDHGLNFAETNLTCAKLRDVDIPGALLTGADLSWADLCGASLYMAEMTEANFYSARLQAVRLRDAILVDSNFERADLWQADFTGSILAGARFAGARMEGTVFGQNDLNGVEGLDLVRHSGPSVIAVDTLFHSKGKIPEVFLRGCGVPDALITYMPSLIGSLDGIQFYSCFISYSHKDDAFDRRLHSRMREAHLRVWFAPEDLRGGEKTHDQVEKAIRIYDKLLVVLSEHSLQSDWVITEIRNARKQERATGTRKLYPIR